MSESSGEYTSSDEAAVGCSVATSDDDCLNETDGYKPTKLQAIRKRSVDPKQGSIIANSREIPFSPPKMTIRFFPPKPYRNLHQNP